MSGSVEKYALKDGSIRWMARYRTPEGAQKKSKGHRTRREAVLYLADVQVKQATGTWIDPQSGKITVGTLYEPWLAAQGHTKATTMHHLKLNWAHHVKPRWQHVEIGKIRPSSVRGWVTEMQSADVGVPTIERAFGILRQILGMAVEDRLIPSNPAAGVKLPRRQHSPRGYLTHQQVQRLADEIGAQGLVVLFLAYTGLRWGEMAALRVQDFDMLRRRVSVTRGVAEVKGKLVWSTPKTNERRTVPFPAFLAEPLAAQMVGRDRDALVLGDGQVVLRNSTWRPRVFNKAIERLCELDDEGRSTTDFPKISPHDLRHPAASLAISAGANVKAVQTMLGHASAAMTLDTYADLFPDDLESVADVLDRQRARALDIGEEGRAPGVPVRV